jgi:hypothetical protein
MIAERFGDLQSQATGSPSYERGLACEAEKAVQGHG